jgi:hypothetical protein
LLQIALQDCYIYLISRKAERDNKMSRIAELENLIAVAFTQRKAAYRLKATQLVRSLNHDLRNWTEELAILKKAGA